MGLQRKTDSSMIYLQVKHFCLWREFKTPTAETIEIETRNPKTGQTIKKCGIPYSSVAGRVVKLVKYDTERKYPTRYFGFKLHMVDGSDCFVLDMPYHSQILRRFLRTAPNIDWSAPLSISIFKSKKEKADDPDSTGVWFQQDGETVRPYYTRESPHGMPGASYDDHTQQWDFRAQHRWLIEKLQQETVSAIENAAASQSNSEDVPNDAPMPSPGDYISDDDVPF